MEEQIAKYKSELDELNKKLTDISKIPTSDLAELFQRQSYLNEIIESDKYVANLLNQLEDFEKIINDGSELADIAKEEIDALKSKLDKAIKKLDLLLVPEDPQDSKNAILEIRQGTGGEEATIFANDLFRMYTRFANLVGFKVQLIDVSESEAGGVREAIFKIIGNNAYKTLKYESGVHRVQRVPVTESAGRVHTSAASVVVMPEVDDISVKVNPSDLRIDVYRSGGHGGQSVNTTDSAVRITHLPTGLVVTCQDTKDQQKNKATALSVLKSRLYKMELEKQQGSIEEIRKSSIKTGDRSDKIKTYNFPQDRLTDHRIHKSWFGLDKFMNGDISDVLEETNIEISKSLNNKDN